MLDASSAQRHKSSTMDILDEIGFDPPSSGESDNENEDDDISETSDNGLDTEPIAFEFLTAPGQTNKILNLADKDDLKIYYRAVENKNNLKFDAKPTGLRTYLRRVAQHGENFGWNTSVFAIPTKGTDVMGETLDFIQNYGNISLRRLKKVARSYIRKQSRAAQDSAMLQAFLFNTLTQTAYQKVTLREEDYTIDGVVVGILVLKVIVMVSHVDNRSTTARIRQQLTELPNYITEIKFDVSKLNEHAATLVDELAAMGETSNDLTVNLFAAYNKVPNTKFTSMVEHLENNWEMGSEKITPKFLMQTTTDKYYSLKQQDRWETVTQEQEGHLALSARIKKLEEGSKPSTKKNGEKKKKEKWYKNTWVTKPPKDGKLTMERNGKTWKWCTFHKRWCDHHVNECRAKKKAEAKSNTSNQENHQHDSETNPSRVLKAQKATLRWSSAASDGSSQE